MGRWLATGLALSLGLLPVGGLVVPAVMAAEVSNPKRLVDVVQLANRQREKGEREAALINYTNALRIARELIERKLEGGIHGPMGWIYKLEGGIHRYMGWIYKDLGNLTEALKSYQQALLIYRSLDLPEGVGNVLHDIGSAYTSLNEYEKALSAYEEALKIMRKENNRKREGLVLNDIGFLVSTRGNMDEALKIYKQALLIRQQENDLVGEGVTTNNIALVYRSQGDLGKALENYEKALKILRKTDDHESARKVVNNIGDVYGQLGSSMMALVYFYQALSMAKDWGDSRLEAVILNNIGKIYSDQKDLDRALNTLQRAADMPQKMKDPDVDAAILNNIAHVYSAQGNPQAALKTYQQALVINRKIGDRRSEAATLGNMATISAGLGDFDQALTAYKLTMVILREVKDSLGEAITLINLAILQRDRQQPNLAIESLEKGLAIQLEIRRGLQRSNRQSFIGQSQGAAASLVELLIEKKMAAKAFTWVNLFATADLADYSRLIEARVSNPEAQRALEGWQLRQVELLVKRQRLEREPNQWMMQQLVEQEASQFLIAEDLIGRYPEIAELLETRPADLQRLQAGIPAGTVVIQPAPLTGVPKRADTMALFALSRTDLQVVTVPLPQDFPALVETYRRQLEKAESYLERSQQLYDLLIRPLEDRGLLPSGSRLAVIATGKLREIPLETLYDGRTKQYLLEKYPIHYLTRLSRNSAPAAQPAGGGSAQRALVLANPTPTAKELPGTEAEADYLVGAYPGSRDLRRGQATLERFQQQASRYPILHLGTHGCFVATGCPDLGMKANTLLFANSQQYPIADAAQLGLSNTELLVLGACQTAQITSDNDVGLSGLAYVWERAGARAVVASLWSAVDAESAQITKAFYGNLKAGMDKAEAMRQAKLALLRRDPDGLHPFVWAPLIVIGDAAPLAR